ncbi:MAG TPA: S8 family serine peptidase [Candidimonas sp.]|nr:S8 family serine peptidase [Candidimonas sp.]
MPWRGSVKLLALAMLPSLSMAQSLGMTANDFIDAEFLSSGTLRLIGAQYAYERGYTGKGITIAIVDTGLDVNHPEFRGKVSPWLQNYVPGWSSTDVSDVNAGGGIAGHGTHVAGLAAAARDGVGMHGVAYGATVLPLRTGFSTDQLESAFARAIQAGARVLNGSYGPNVLAARYIDDEAHPGYKKINPTYKQLNYQPISVWNLQNYDGLKQAEAADVVMVFSAGNDREMQPGAYTAMPEGMGMLPLITPGNTAANVLYRFLDPNEDINPHDPTNWRFVDPVANPDWRDTDYSSLRGALMSVVSTDPAGAIAQYSNWCGAAKAWCLAAPGGGFGSEGTLQGPVWSSLPYSSYGFMSGTSMASPVVAGAAAVMRQAFPYMTARQIIEVMLTTANSTGAWADSDIYGHGMLDLGKAIRGPAVFGEGSTAETGFPTIFSVDTRGYDSMWSNNISGVGGMAKAGAGVLTMTGANSYTGATDITGGKLVVNGSIASSALLTIGKDAALGGNGTVGKTQVHGKVAPGNSVGTLTVVGNYTQFAGSVLAIELGEQGSSDKIIVHGNVDIQGGRLHVESLRGEHVGRRYTFIEAAGTVGGAFDESVLGRLFVDLRLLAGPSAVALSVDRNATAFTNFARTDGQRAVAGAMDSQGLGGLAFGEVAAINDASVLPALYQSLTGEVYASTRSALFDTADAVRLANVRRARQAGHGAWGQAFGSWGRLGGGGDARPLSRSMGGLVFGGDTAIGRQARAGLSFAYTNSRLGDHAYNRVKADGHHLTAYAGSQYGAWALRGGLTQSWYTVDTQRRLASPVHSSAASKADAQALQLFTEAGYAIDMGTLKLEPYAGLSQVWLSQSGFDEDNPVFGLRSARTHSAVTFSTLGLRSGLALEDDKGRPIQVNAGLGWRYALGDVKPERDLRFATGRSYTIGGAPLARNALIVEAELEWAAGKFSHIGLGYSGQVAGPTHDHSMRANLRWAF